jgi:murein DD-endopeptidase MepM/ murein hydrolase activator NlpD
MDEGSWVTAIRGGVVGFVRDNNDVRGTEEKFRHKGNQILICHDDGTVAIYAHLKQKGSLVNIGDKIFAGQPIGLSGNTGFSTTPHLHLVVMVGTQSIPIQFRNLPDTLVQGLTYKQDYQF